MVVDIVHPDPLSDEEVDRIFQALADSTRRDILRRTTTAQESVSALSRHYEISLPAVQKHVGVLEKARLVTRTRQGRETVVHAHIPTVEKAMRLLEIYERLWRGRTDRIAALFEEDE